MTRSILCGLMAVLSVGALGVVPLACQSGGVGDPCTPEDEYSATFSGFHVDLSNIESRSFQCATRICLVNHFQGRVSCPLGQDGTKLTACNGTGDTTTCAASGKTCAASDVFSPTCMTNPDCPGWDPMTGHNTLGFICQGGACQCTTAQMINGNQYACEQADPKCTGTNCARVLQTFFCHTAGCQQAGAKDTDNNGKDCCIPGTQNPVGVTVCGQCGAMSKRDATNAVYCSCRCCAPCCDSSVKTADDANKMGCSLDMSTCGSNCDPNFNYCSCPSGYTCTNIREFVGLGDQNLAGAYCVTAGTAFQSTVPCMVDALGFTGDSSCQQ